MTQQNKAPSPEQNSLTMSHLRVGSLAVRDETLSDGRRVLWFPHGDADRDLASVARWSERVDLERSDTDHGCIILPSAIRPARSVLGGMTAFEGEKQEVVSFMGSYIRTVLSEFNGVDTSLSLDSVAVCHRGEEAMMVVPPHNLVTDPGAIEDWATALEQDMRNVLSHEAQHEELLQVLSDATQTARTAIS